MARKKSAGGNKMRTRANLTIDRKLLARFRLFVSRRNAGSTYGRLKSEAEAALDFWMKHHASHDPSAMVGGGAVEVPEA